MFFDAVLSQREVLPHLSLHLLGQQSQTYWNFLTFFKEKSHQPLL